MLRSVLANGALVHGVNRPGFGGRGVFIEGDDLEPELKNLGCLLGEAGVFMDVGANTGVYALKAAKHYGSKGLVIAVEPNLQMLSTLSYSVRINGFSNVRLRNFGIGARRSTASLWMNRDMPNSFSLERRMGDADGLSVLVITLDELCAWEGISNLDYLKVDVEGGEMAVMAGARETVERFRPIVQLETSVEVETLRLPSYHVFQAPGSPNTVFVPDEHPKAALLLDLGWSPVGARG